MKTTVTRRYSFNASHQTIVCGNHPHGHDWFFEVCLEGEPNAEGYLSPALANHQLWLVSELDYRNLNEMVVGAPPTPEGIAAWGLERLRGQIPGLRSVTVGFRGYQATVEV